MFELLRKLGFIVGYALIGMVLAGGRPVFAAAAPAPVQVIACANYDTSCPNYTQYFSWIWSDNLDPTKAYIQVDSTATQPLCGGASSATAIAVIASQVTSAQCVLLGGGSGLSGVIGSILWQNGAVITGSSASSGTVTVNVTSMFEGLTPDGAAAIAASILALWAVAWVSRQFVKAFR